MFDERNLDEVIINGKRESWRPELGRVVSDWPSCAAWPYEMKIMRTPMVMMRVMMMMLMKMMMNLVGKQPVRAEMLGKTPK